MRGTHTGPLWSMCLEMGLNIILPALVLFPGACSSSSSSSNSFFALRFSLTTSSRVWASASQVSEKRDTSSVSFTVNWRPVQHTVTCCARGARQVMSWVVTRAAVTLIHKARDVVVAVRLANDKPSPVKEGLVAH